MDPAIEEKKQREIIKRALEKAHRKERQREGDLYIKDTLEALHEITELSRVELDMIAEEVSASYADDIDQFFSIKNQIIIACVAVFIFMSIPIAAVWLF